MGSMQPKLDWYLEADIMRLLPRCSHDENVYSMEPQRDCCLVGAPTSFHLDATKRGLARCSHNKGFGSKQPQQDCCLDADTTRLHRLLMHRLLMHRLLMEPQEASFLWLHQDNNLIMSPSSQPSTQTIVMAASKQLPRSGYIETTIVVTASKHQCHCGCIKAPISLWLLRDKNFTVAVSRQKSRCGCIEASSLL